MWQGTEVEGVGEVPGLPLDQLRSLIHNLGLERTGVPVRPDSPFAHQRVATTATAKPLSSSKAAQQWPRLGDNPLRVDLGWLADLAWEGVPVEVPFLALVGQEPSAPLNDRAKAPWREHKTEGR